MITIYDRNGAVLLQVEVDSTSYVFKQLMGDNSLVLNYSLPEHVELPVGSYCIFQGETYTVVSPEAVKKQHSRYYEYAVTFESAQSKAKFRKFRNSVDGRLTFSLTARPKEHLQMFVDNMNRHDSGWEVDEANCIDATEKVISYDHSSCLEALKMMADAFETEWEIVGKRVVLKKVEYNRSEPLALSYGRGNGFKPGLGRSNFSDSPAVEILLPQGGERNIIRSEYGSPTLLLPLGQTLAYDGEYFEDEAGFNPATARTYITEADGRSLQRVGRTFDTYAEESLDCTEFYPKRVGVVTAVEVNSDGIYTFTDDTIPDDLNYLDHIIGGETMTVIFQSGQLAGREFEVRYKHSHEVADGNGGRETVYDKCFSIVPADIDGVEMPGGIFVPQTASGDREADTYVVFNCSLPDEYICDNATKSGASWDMFRAAVRYLYDHEDQRFSFTGELDGLWAKGDWENIGGKIKLGGYISFTDAHFQAEPVLVRIIGIRQYVNNPHTPKLELSNATVSGGFSTELKRIESTEVKVEDRHKEAVNYAKRRFKDAQETIEMLSQAFSGNYTNPIRPSTIQSLMALIGDERLQFSFCSMPTASNPTGTQRDVNITHDAATDTITVSVPNGTVLHHLTLGNHTMTASNGASDAKYYWNISSFQSGDLYAEKAYYIYAKCSKDTTLNGSLGINVGGGSFYVSDKSVDMDGRGGDTDFFYFLVAVLGSRDTMGERSHSKVYGFTEILPGRITTDVIKSADGKNVIDLLLGRFLLGDSQSGLSWNENGNGKLVIKGAIQVDGGGNEGPTIVQRGAFSTSARYYWGNVVTYNGASYMCLDDSVSGISGIYPTNTSKWRVFAERGVNGNYVEFRYARHNSATSAPNFPTGSVRYLRNINSYGFYTTRPSTNSSYPYIWKTSAEINGADNTVWDGWQDPWLDTPLNGHDGQDGEDGEDGHSPYIGANGNWWEWDADNNQYHDTGIKAEGQGGEDGAPGRSTLTSYVFRRSSSSLSRPTGGSFSSPFPSGSLWSDGVPSGTDPLYISSRIFTSDGGAPQQSEWSTPSLVADTADIDFEFSDIPVNPGNPTDNPLNWHNTATQYDRWMAVRKRTAGIWSSWEVTKIKGEDGKPGTPGLPGTDGKWTKFQYAVAAVNYATETNGAWDFSGIPAGLWSWTYPSTSFVGMFVYIRQMESSDGGLTWSEIPDSRGWWHDPSIDSELNSIATAGREKIAKYLGYNDWQSFQNVIGANDVLIDGGYLNANLIRADALLAYVISTAMAGRGITMVDNSLIVTNDQGAQMMAFSGALQYINLNAFITPGGSQSSRSFGYDYQFSLPVSVNGDNWESRSNVNIATSGTLSVTSRSSYSGCPTPNVTFPKTNATIINGYVDITVGYENTSTGEIYPAGHFIRSTETAINRSVFSGGVVPAGTYKLTAVASFSLAGDPTSSYGNPSIGISITGSQTIYFTPISQGTEVFSNGFGYRYDISNYMAAVRSSSGLEWGVRSGNYGLKLDSSGIGMMLDGSSWKSPFIIEIAASLTCSSSGVTINSQTSQTGNRISAAQRTGTGAYTITLSSSVGNYACVIATPRNSSTSSTSLMWVQSQSGTAVKIYNRTSSSGGSNASDPSGFNLLIIKTS